MKNKTIAVFIIFTLVLCLLAACKKDDANGIVVVDDKGVTRVLATDDKGETMTDEAGNLIVVVTGLDGKEETQRVAPPDYYAVGNKIQTPKYAVDVPEGWTQSSMGNVIRLTHTQTKSELNLVTMDGKTLDDAIASAEETMELFKKEGTVETAEASICGVAATKYTVSKADEGKVVFYIFEKNAAVYSFYSVVMNEYKDSVDFDAIINSIQFK